MIVTEERAVRAATSMRGIESMPYVPSVVFSRSCRTREVQHAIARYRVEQQRRVEHGVTTHVNGI